MELLAFDLEKKIESIVSFNKSKKPFNKSTSTIEK